jgi:hypothetical protein
MTVAVCRKCGHPIERTERGGWGTRVRMIRGCAHIPRRDSIREAVDG